MAGKPADREGSENALAGVVAGAQFARRVAERLDGDRKERFNQARIYVNSDAKERLVEAGVWDEKIHLGRENAAYLRSRFTDLDERLGLLITALLGNPVAPYEIKIPEKIRHSALKAFAEDLGSPPREADAVIEAVARALKTQADFRALIIKSGMIVVGVALVAAMPLLIPVAGAGLAGGAAIVAGLAAIGPGGMLGGLAVVAAVGAGGGGLATVSLTTGNHKAVQQNVVIIHALALAKLELRPFPRPHSEVKSLEAMKVALQSEIERRKGVDDRYSSGGREAKKKLDDIQRALDDLRKAMGGGNG